LEVCGCARLDYPHVRISIKNDSIFSQETRRYPRLVYPVVTKKTANLVTFYAHGPAAFGTGVSQGPLFRILANATVLLQLGIGVVLLVIPRLLRRLESVLVADIERNLPQKDNPNNIIICFLR
jgi:hypothetical protein